MSEHEGLEDHDLGLAHDLPELLNRRRALGLLSGVGLAAALSACGIDRFSDPVETEGPASPAPLPGDPDGGGPGIKVEEGEIPSETGGPFPADGSDGRNILRQTGIVRSDITKSFGGPTAVAKGVATTVTLTLLNKDGDSSKPYTGAALYLWQCDAKGRYSMYHPILAHQNYLRGLQVADKQGRVTFRSIFPAAYGGRWPHLHFEVYESEESATKTQGRLRTSQLALPEQTCHDVYATPDYALSRPNLAQASLKNDIVFRDGYDLQMAKVTGSVRDGLHIGLDIPI
jgi:protocatechuate 3,4-dioxygenase beta subunit